mgnify:CR=1 FL=1|tara:strand:+ start:153 stop:677 length:525 start_codon:yes stop_codon:yes gene_type:complete
MAQEFTINSSAIETKINQLLPSQGGFGAGIDFSASTMVIPIVDLTETAEGGGVRADLQAALSLTSITAFSVAGSTATLVNTTGYFRVFGLFNATPSSSADRTGNFSLTDGTTTKIIQKYVVKGTSAEDHLNQSFDFIVFLPAGVSLTATSDASPLIINGNTRQLASIDGTLTNP